MKDRERDDKTLHCWVSGEDSGPQKRTAPTELFN